MDRESGLTLDTPAWCGSSSPYRQINSFRKKTEMLFVEYVKHKMKVFFLSLLLWGILAFTVFKSLEFVYVCFEIADNLFNFNMDIQIQWWDLNLQATVVIVALAVLGALLTIVFFWRSNANHQTPHHYYKSIQPTPTVATSADRYSQHELGGAQK